MKEKYVENEISHTSFFALDNQHKQQIHGFHSDRLQEDREGLAGYETPETFLQ